MEVRDDEQNNDKAVGCAAVFVLAVLIFVTYVVFKVM